MKLRTLLPAALLCTLPLQPALLFAEKPETARKVTVENFPRAESDLYFSAVVAKGGFGKWDHTRELAKIDDQTVIRLNRDTLYSAAVFDLDAGSVTITLPETEGRFISLQVINQDHYTAFVAYAPGSYTLTRDSIGTRYAVAAIRILVNPNDEKDLKAVHALQDQVEIQQDAPGSFEVPQWDPKTQKTVRDALITLSDTLPDKNQMFGKKEDVDPVRFLLGTASAWGGNPDKDATYLNVVPEKNDGKTLYRLTVKDVPVDGFWSISVYNADGYYVKNDRDVYTINNLTAKRNDDDSITIQFGGKEGDAPNVIPVPENWNYLVRLYRPRAEILDGKWSFPEATPIQ